MAEMKQFSPERVEQINERRRAAWLAIKKLRDLSHDDDAPLSFAELVKLSAWMAYLEGIACVNGLPIDVFEDRSE